MDFPIKSETSLWLPFAVNFSTHEITSFLYVLLLVIIDLISFSKVCTLFPCSSTLKQKINRYFSLKYLLYYVFNMTLPLNGSKMILFRDTGQLAIYWAIASLALLSDAAMLIEFFTVFFREALEVLFQYGFEYIRRTLYIFCRLVCLKL